MINLFAICSAEEQRHLRTYADRQVWELQCQALGATLPQIRAYDMDAWRYACTTIAPNGTVIAYARWVAKDALARGEPMPTSAEQAIKNRAARKQAGLIS